jgi:hypothetical protein
MISHSGEQLQGILSLLIDSSKPGGEPEDGRIDERYSTESGAPSLNRDSSDSAQANHINQVVASIANFTKDNTNWYFYETIYQRVVS